MKQPDIQVLRHRLTPEHLTENTRIFSYEESGVEGLKIADRFRQYWKTWVEQELSALFIACIECRSQTGTNIFISSGREIIPVHKHSKEKREQSEIIT